MGKESVLCGEARRQELLESITNSETPVSGTALARKFGVSRQVIVQDIALLRAGEYDILSTNRGYLLQMPKRAVRVFCVRHTDGQIEDELNTIVDCGAVVKDVFVNHEVYGEIRADLNISSRLLVKKFLESLESGVSQPLKNVTREIHCHTVCADSYLILDSVGLALQEKGYLQEAENSRS